MLGNISFVPIKQSAGGIVDAENCRIYCKKQNFRARFRGRGPNFSGTAQFQFALVTPANAIKR